MIGQKTMMLAAAGLAIGLAFLLVGMSYLLFPDQSLQKPPVPSPIPKPEPIINQVFWALQWISLAAVLALAIVGVMLLVARTRSKKTSLIALK